MLRNACQPDAARRAQHFQAAHPIRTALPLPSAGNVRLKAVLWVQMGTLSGERCSSEAAARAAAASTASTAAPQALNKDYVVPSPAAGTKKAAGTVYARSSSADKNEAKWGAAPESSAAAAGGGAQATTGQFTGAASSRDVGASIQLGVRSSSAGAAAVDGEARRAARRLLS